MAQEGVLNFAVIAGMDTEVAFACTLVFLNGDESEAMSV